MMRTIFLLVALSAFAATAFAQNNVEPPLITVTGEAEVKVAPDEVVFDVTVQTLNRDLRVAKSQTDDRLRKVLDLTRKYQVETRDVQTDYIRLEPRYRGNDDTRTFLGYSVRKDVVFTLRDVTKAEGLLSEIMESGVSRINSIRFQTSQLRKYRDQARAMAIKAAREKAIALTTEIGQTIGSAYSIEEEAPPRPNPYANITQNTSGFIGDTSDQTEGTLALGVIAINARVTVKFELKSR
jgi:uncharacterized protein YggE